MTRTSGVPMSKPLRLLTAVLTGGALCVATEPAYADLGAAGTVAIESDLQLGALHTSDVREGTTLDADTIIQARLRPQLFVADDVSVGALFQLDGDWDDDDDHQVTIGAGPVVGYHRVLAPRVHLWPRAAASYAKAYVHNSFFGVDLTARTVTLDVAVPVFYEPSSHWYVGVAPRYARTLWGDVSDGSPASTQSYYGLIAILGAYLGG
ncbi:MAG: hypothetical protein H6708_24445 [Kofleriaceae bacterium]|nr:hypothetical protein [Kofleriaceae bacterium]